MHRWGDENVDWNGINDAAKYIADFLTKFGRVSVFDYKEKFGEVRVYCNLGWTSLHSIIYPGYAYSQFPQWLWVLDLKFFTYVLKIPNRIVIRYHSALYRLAYKYAVKKWPHLHDEILNAADFPELLEGL